MVLPQQGFQSNVLDGESIGPYGWAFIWEANSKKYFNVITNQTVGSKGEIPHETTKKKGNVDGISANSSLQENYLKSQKPSRTFHTYLL